MAQRITFVYADWIVAYPAFTVGGAQPVSQALAQTYFNTAGFLCANDGSGPVCDDAELTNLLYILTAHIAAISAPLASGGAANGGLVGRITSASEGSVSVGVENSYAEGSAQWYQQSQYGSLYWLLTARYRQFQYSPGPVMGVPANQYGGLWAGYGRGLPYRRC